jgi:CubicO group peptidase (beta-lactamase class C family)
MGSVSKQFTAATVLALARDGRVDLAAPVGRYVRDLPPGLGDRPVVSLLSHTSGIPDYEGLPGFDADRHIERPALIKGFAAKPQDFAPGEGWAYSNSGYVLLGYLIADVTGTSYHDAVRARLLQPAGFVDARFDDATAIIPGRAEPYVLEHGEVRHATQMDGDYSGWPDGGLLMSARDAGRWESVLQAGRVIPPADLRRMTTSVTLADGHRTAYGFGWFLDRVGGREVHYHSGSVPGFLTFYLRLPAERIGAMVLVNIESPLAGRAIRDIALDLVETAAPGTTVLALRPIKDDAPTLTRQARAMIVRKGAPLDAALFTPAMARLLANGTVAPPDLGGLELKAFALVEAFDEAADHVRRYRATFADRTAHLAFAHAPDGRIFRVRSI